MAQSVSLKSKDRSTKVGCVIVGPMNEVRSLGYNGFPRNVNDDVEERHERPMKYLYTEHAERNALYNSLLANVSVKCCTLYMNYTLSPCADCARGIIQSGISRIVTSNVEFPGLGAWSESMEAAKVMLAEAGIEVVIASIDPR